MMYEGVSKSFRTGCLEQMVQLSATRCSCIAILWVSLVSFAAVTLCVASQRVFIVISLSTQSGNLWIHSRMIYGQNIDLGRSKRFENVPQWRQVHGGNWLNGKADCYSAVQEIPFIAMFTSSRRCTLSETVEYTHTVRCSLILRVAAASVWPFRRLTYRCVLWPHVSPSDAEMKILLHRCIIRHAPADARISESWPYCRRKQVVSSSFGCLYPLHIATLARLSCTCSDYTHYRCSEEVAELRNFFTAMRRSVV
jgi:hypothetical protein